MIKITFFPLVLLCILQSCVTNPDYKNNMVENLTNKNPEYKQQIDAHVKESQKDHQFKNSFDNKLNGYSYRIESRLKSSHSIGSANASIHLGYENYVYIHKIKVQTLCTTSANNFQIKPFSYKKITWKIPNTLHIGEAYTDHDGFFNISIAEDKKSMAFKKLFLNYDTKDYTIGLDTLKKENILSLICD